MPNFHLNTRINGTFISCEVPQNTLLIDFLRDRGLTGTKPSCELEVCGACTVLVDSLPASSCTTLAAESHKRNLETIEGLHREGGLTPVQKAFSEEFAFQCGFCTPGMIMSAESLLRQNTDPSREDIIHWLDGNICRCTGYESIVRAVQNAAKKLLGENKEEGGPNEQTVQP